MNIRLTGIVGGALLAFIVAGSQAQAQTTITVIGAQEKHCRPAKHCPPTPKPTPKPKPKPKPTPTPGGDHPPGYGPGIAGHVTIGPVMPVCQVGVPCDKPYAYATVLILDTAGRLIDSATTNAQGAYIVRVPPGDYVAHIDTTAIFPRCPDVNVTVGNSQFATADISCDTGIR